MASDAKTDGAASADPRGLRDVTLYEDEGDERLWPEACTERSKPVPAVVGITVAEIEAADDLRAERDDLRDRVVPLLEVERDEARAERDNVSVEAHHWMGEAARYREALERIMRDEPIGVHGVPVPLDVLVAELRAIAREALGGGE